MEQSGGIVCPFCRLLHGSTRGNRLLILLLHVCIYTECCMSANSDSLDSTSDANESPYVTLQHQILRRSRVPFADRQRQTECHDPFGAGILFAVSVDKIVEPLIRFPFCIVSDLRIRHQDSRSDASIGLRAASAQPLSEQFASADQENPNLKRLAFYGLVMALGRRCLRRGAPCSRRSYNHLGRRYKLGLW
jgi:hypothetical protein